MPFSKKQVPVLRHHILPEAFSVPDYNSLKKASAPADTAVIFLQDFIVTRVSRPDTEKSHFLYVLVDNLLLCTASVLPFPYHGHSTAL